MSPRGRIRTAHLVLHLVTIDEGKGSETSIHKTLTSSEVVDNVVIQVFNPIRL
jgi:hypothetical protein